MTLARWLPVALLLSSCLGVPIESAAPIDVTAPGTWTTLAAMPTARQEVAVAALEGKVFVIGGFGANAEPVDAVEVYDPATNRWEPRAPLPAPSHHAAAAVVDGRLFVIGGYTGGRVSWRAESTVYEYAAVRNAWVTRAPLPTPRGALAVATLRGRIHAVGGDAEAITPAHEIYDPVADRWSGASPMRTARDHLAAVAFDGRLWALGGRRSFMGEQYAVVEIYDPATELWREGPPLPNGRGGLAAVALADRIMVFGGEAPLRIFSASEMFEVAGNRWIAKAPMPTPRHGIGAVAIGGHVYVVGGGTQPGFARSGANERYTP